MWNEHTFRKNLWGQIGGHRKLWFLFKRFCQDIFGVVVFLLVAMFIGRLIGRKLFGDYADIELVAIYAGTFWVNLILLPRIAAAAALLIVCVAGWRYMSDGAITPLDQPLTANPLPPSNAVSQTPSPTQQPPIPYGAVRMPTPIRGSGSGALLS